MGIIRHREEQFIHMRAHIQSPVHNTGIICQREGEFIIYMTVLILLPVGSRSSLVHGLGNVTWEL